METGKDYAENNCHRNEWSLRKGNRMPSELNDAIIFQWCSDLHIERVIAVTEDGRAVVMPYRKTRMEDAPDAWARVGRYKKNLLGDWKFIPNATAKGDNDNDLCISSIGRELG